MNVLDALLGSFAAMGQKGIEDFNASVSGYRRLPGAIETDAGPMIVNPDGSWSLGVEPVSQTERLLELGGDLLGPAVAGGAIAAKTLGKVGGTVLGTFGGRMGKAASKAAPKSDDMVKALTQSLPMDEASRMERAAENVPFDSRQIVRPIEMLVKKLRESGWAASARYPKTGSIYVHLRNKNNFDRPFEIRVSDHGKRLFETDDDFYRVRLDQNRTFRQGDKFDIDPKKTDAMAQVEEAIRLINQEIAQPQVAINTPPVAGSRFAAFDPAKKDSSDLLASFANLYGNIEQDDGIDAQRQALMKALMGQ